MPNYDHPPSPHPITHPITPPPLQGITRKRALICHTLLLLLLGRNHQTTWGPLNGIVGLDSPQYPEQIERHSMVSLLMRGGEGLWTKIGGWLIGNAARLIRHRPWVRVWIQAFRILNWYCGGLQNTNLDRQRRGEKGHYKFIFKISFQIDLMT